ncbi:MAG: hypothetical protein HRT58_21540 [Crocinitomicaceae bacterium]|nr:hypothetical protein [Crocinitomicaceae bacterium]
MKWVAILSIIGICLYFVNQWYFKRTLANNGVTTFAIVENIRHQRYVADESGGGGQVNHYYVSYKFKVKKEWVHCMTEVKSYLFNSYLGENPKKGDTIQVIFLLESPKTNELLELK